MNIHKLVITIPKPPFFPNSKPLPKTIEEFAWDEWDDALTPCNSPTKHYFKKKIKIAKYEPDHFHPFDNLDEFLQFYSEL